MENDYRLISKPETKSIAVRVNGYLLETDWDGLIIVSRDHYHAPLDVLTEFGELENDHGNFLRVSHADIAAIDEAAAWLDAERQDLNQKAAGTLTHRPTAWAGL